MVQSWTTFAKAVLSVDSNETNLLRKLLGYGISYDFVKAFLRRDKIKIKIDAERGCVLVTKDEKTHEVTFDEIEQAINTGGL